MNFSLKTNESAVLKTVLSMMSDLSPFGYFAVTKDGLKFTSKEFEYDCVKMRFEVSPEKVSVLECHRDTFQAFHPSDIVNYLKKVSRSDTLYISDDDYNIIMYSVSQKKDMSVRTTFRKSNAEYIEYSFLDDVYDSQGILVDTKDFFTACENTNTNISNKTKIKLIGEFGLEVSFDTEFVSRCVTRLGDVNSVSIESIFNRRPVYTFQTQKIMMLKKIQTLSPKIRLYFKSGFPMMIVSETTLGPLKFLVDACE